MKKVLYLTLLLTIAFLGTASAQLKTPQPSPSAKVSQEVGLTKVELDYSRPSARGRKIFGDLVRFGEMWRTGANASTKVTFSDDVTIGAGKIALPKGTYALYTTPNEKSWNVIFYKNITINGVPGTNFKQEDVAAQFDIASKTTADKVETFTISIENITNSTADLQLVWENTKVVIPFVVPTDAKVSADIKAQMDGPSAGTYYAAARYYFEEKKDLNQALEWVNKSLEKGGDKFWIMRVKAQILAELGRYAEAITVAEASTALANKEGNKDYPAMNDKSVAEWKKKK